MDSDIRTASPAPSDSSGQTCHTAVSEHPTSQRPRSQLIFRPGTKRKTMYQPVSYVLKNYSTGRKKWSHVVQKYAYPSSWMKVRVVNGDEPPSKRKKVREEKEMVEGEDARKENSTQTPPQPAPKFGSVYTSQAGEGDCSDSDTSTNTVATMEPEPSGLVVVGLQGYSASTASPMSIPTFATPQRITPSTSISPKADKPTFPLPEFSPKHVVRYRSEDPEDVEIRVLDTAYYLHSVFLRQNCGWFASSTSKSWSGTRAEGVGHYKYSWSMVFDGATCILEQTYKADPKLTREPLGPLYLETAELRENPLKTPSSKPVHELFAKTFRMMMDAVYHAPTQQPIMDLATAEFLAHQAKMYQCLPAVSHRIDSAIKSWENWPRLVQKHSLRFLMLANMIQSPTIFKEAFLHCVGKYHLRPTDAEVWMEATIWHTFDELKGREWHKTYELYLPTAIHRMLTAESQRLDFLSSQALKRCIRMNFGPEKPPSVRQTVKEIRDRIFETYGGLGQDGALYRAIVSDKWEPTKQQIEKHEQQWKDKGTPADLKRMMGPAIKVIKNMCRPMAENSSKLTDDLPGYILSGKLSDEEAQGLWNKGGKLYVREKGYGSVIEE